LGDDRARSLIRSQYERVCEESIARHHGHVFKKLGDGILADFSSARQAVLCATDIHQQLAADGGRLMARVAITVGEPLEEAGDFFGSAVNAAQRAASVGRAGETVLAAAVPEVVGLMRGIKFVELAPQRLKGLPPRQILFLAADATTTGPRAAVTKLRSWPRVRWIALTGTFVFAVLVFVGLSTANSPGGIALSDPSGIAVDASGRAYVISGNRILMVSDGTTSTFAGSGVKGFAGDGGSARLAELGAPEAVAVSPVGDVYIADTGNDRIRRVHDGLITTVVGDGVPAYGGDGGQATSAHITAPEGVAVDSRGDIFVADNGNNVVRKVNSAGIITTVAGSATANRYMDGAMAISVKLGSPIGIAANEVGDVWFTADQAIYHLSSDGRIHQIAGADEPGYSGDGGPATSAVLRDPEGLAIHGSDLFVADTDNERVRKIDGSGVITTVAGTGLKGYSGDSGEATSAQLTSPGDVGLDRNGRLFIADTGNNHLRLVTVAGLITTVA